MFAIKKRIDSVIDDPVVRNEARRYSIRTRLAFLPDDVIGHSFYFRILTWFYYNLFVYFHGFEIVGMEKIDPDEGCLFISRHSTHNAEIQGVIVCAYHQTGRVIRSLIHRYLIPMFPILRFMGSVPGERRTALSLLKSGFWVAVIPGGADEAMIGNENAYKVSWPKKRKGFAHIATEANVPIVPTFLANQEEMRWNPFLYFWNFFGLGRLFSFLVQLNIPIFSHLLNLIGMFIWFSVTWFQIPLPAKITLYIGDPIQYDMSVDTIDDVVERSRRSLQNLIDQHQPRGKSYSNAIYQRIEHLKRQTKTCFS